MASISLAAMQVDLATVPLLVILEHEILELVAREEGDMINRARSVAV
jgi:hypothetical protein